MPRKSAKQMRLFQMRAERKRKRRDRGHPSTTPERRAQPGTGREPEAEPVQLDLIAHLDKLDSPG
jgi:hypothetical protein